MSCITDLAQYILYIVNTLVFLAAAASLSFCIFLFYDDLSSAFTSFNLLTLVSVITIPLMLFACFGCRAAGANEPLLLRKRQSKPCRGYWYLALVIALFFAALSLTVVLWNVNDSLKSTKDAVIYHASAGGTAVLHLLHHHLMEFYDKKICTGGNANSTTIPLAFTRVTCRRSEARAGTINALFRPHVISSSAEFDRYRNCTYHPSFTVAGQNPSSFTQAFCGSLVHILDFAMRYCRFLMWCPLGLVIVLTTLVIATFCIVCDSQQQKQPLAEESEML